MATNLNFLEGIGTLVRSRSNQSWAKQTCVVGDLFFPLCDHNTYFVPTIGAMYFIQILNLCKTRYMASSDSFEEY